MSETVIFQELLQSSLIIYLFICIKISDKILSVIFMNFLLIMFKTQRQTPFEHVTIAKTKIADLRYDDLCLLYF